MNIFKRKTYNQLAEEAIQILQKVREKITDDSDLVWTSYESVAELHADIDNIISKLPNGDKEILEEANLHFLPTSTFQEHSLQNGWSNEYHKLAEKFDTIYESMKKLQP